MSPHATLTAEQIADFHDELEEQQDDILAAGQSRRKLTRTLPRCFTCASTPIEIVISAPDADGEPVKLVFDRCGHTFLATPDVMAAGLRIHNTRRQAPQ
ncbi:hypothetical protein ACWC1C_07675 [Streptomyces sp. NPDC001705]